MCIRQVSVVVVAQHHTQSAEYYQGAAAQQQATASLLLAASGGAAAAGSSRLLLRHRGKHRSLAALHFEEHLVLPDEAGAEGRVVLQERGVALRSEAGGRLAGRGVPA